MTVGSRPACARVRMAAAPLGERRPAPALVDLDLRQRAHPDGHRGDHPEGALGAEDQLAQVGPGRVGRCAAEVEPAARGGDGEPDDQRVEAAVAGAGLAARAGRGEAADRGVLPRLRVVAERQALGGEQRLGLGTAQARLEGRGHRGVVDRDQPLHPHQVEAEHAGEPLASGDQPTRDRRTAAERDHREVVLDREGEHGRDLVVGAGTYDGVGRVGQVAGPHPEQVGRGLAAGAQPAGLVVGAHVLGAEEAGQLGQQLAGRSPAARARARRRPSGRRARRPAPPSRGPRRGAPGRGPGRPSGTDASRSAGSAACVTL